MNSQHCLGGGISLVRHIHYIIHVYRVVAVDYLDLGSRFFRLEEIRGRICSPRVPFKRGEFRGGAPDHGHKRLVQRTHGLMDSIVIRSAFHVGCKSARKIGDQQYDLALGIIGGGRRELLNLRFRLF